jgi:hypothetical protein
MTRLRLLAAIAPVALVLAAPALAAAAPGPCGPGDVILFAGDGGPVVLGVETAEAPEGTFLPPADAPVEIPLPPPPGMRQFRWIFGPGGGDRVFRIGDPEGRFIGPLRKVKVTYLGVATSPVTETLAEQLRLPPGIGLVVDFVAPESPAGKAGLRQHDVLRKLDDQLLVNAPQLAVLVRMHKPGEEVTLTLLRGGEEEKVPVALGETEQVAGAAPPFLPPAFVMPERGGLSLDDLIARRGGAWHGGFAAPGASMTFSDGEHTLSLTIRDGRKHLVVNDKDGKVVFDGPVQTDEERAKVPEAIRGKLARLEEAAQDQARSEVTVADGEHTLTVTTTDGRRHLRAEDKDGKVLFEGPIDTEEQLQAVPPEIREKLKSLGAVIIEGPVVVPAPEGIPF